MTQKKFSEMLLLLTIISPKKVGISSLIFYILYASFYKEASL